MGFIAKFFAHVQCHFVYLAFLVVMRPPQGHFPIRIYVICKIYVAMLRSLKIEIVKCHLVKFLVVPKMLSYKN